MNTKFGYVRVAAAVPHMKVADCPYNAEQIKKQITEALLEGVEVICFPELRLYLCRLILHTTAAEERPVGSGKRVRVHAQLTYHRDCRSSAESR